MKQEINMLGKPIELEMSKSAERQIENIDSQLCVEMELYFSCLLRKRVMIRETIDSEFSVVVSDKLKVGFRPVMTKTCSVSGCEGESPPLSDFPIAKPESYIPHWLSIDYKKGKWIGEFGYRDEMVRVAVEAKLAGAY